MSLDISKIKNIYTYENNCFYKSDLFNRFAKAYISSKQKSNYNLYHSYIFRAKYIEDNYIKGNSKYNNCIDKLGNVDWTNEIILKDFNHFTGYFIGYMKYNKRSKLYKELFINFTELEIHPNKPTYDVNGYTINLHNKNYNYMFEDTKDLGYTQFLELPISCNHELYIQFNKFIS